MKILYPSMKGSYESIMGNKQLNNFSSSSMNKSSTIKSLFVNSS